MLTRKYCNSGSFVVSLSLKAKVTKKGKLITNWRHHPVGSLCFNTMLCFFVQCIVLYCIGLHCTEEIHRSEEIQRFPRLTWSCCCTASQLYCTVTTVPTNQWPPSRLAEDNEQWSPSTNEESSRHNVHISSGKRDNTFVSFIFRNHEVGGGKILSQSQSHQLQLRSFLWFIKTKNVNLLTSARWWKYKSLSLSYSSSESSTWQLQSES